MANRREQQPRQHRTMGQRRSGEGGAVVILDSNLPAFPIPMVAGHVDDVCHQPVQLGISIRTYIATKVFAAMIGICRGGQDAAAVLNGEVAKASVRYADQLIAALNEPTKAGG